LDAVAFVGLEASWHPAVVARVWREERPGERWPVLHKAIETPAGQLTAAIRLTEDLPHPQDVPLHSDWNVSRYVKPWLETEADVERYRYVQLPPSAPDIATARDRIACQRQAAERLGVATYAACGMGLTAALQLFGAQQAALLSMDQPGLLRRFLQIEHEATMARAAVLAEAGVDILCRNGFYETTDFWSPDQLKAWVAPLLREEVEAMGFRGAAVIYTVETGVMPLLGYLDELPFDGYHAIEPALGQQDLRQVAARLGPRHSLWGGVSGPLHLGEGSPEVARQAVRDAFDACGRRGLVLSAVPSIRAHWPWANALAMFEEWRRLR
jgi:uroporphyrinogen-III decarboxylase